MAKKVSTAKVGLFIFLGLLILIVGIFLIGKKEALFSSTFTVRAYFNDIQGLRNGAIVRLSGIDVGSVKEVSIIPSGKVEVKMEVIDDVHQFVKTDTKATIETEGLVGSKVVVLKIGSSNAEEVKNGGTVQSVEPLGISAVIQETQGVIQYTKEMTKGLSEIIDRVNKGEGTIGKLLKDNELYYSATDLTKEAGKSLQSMTEQVNQLTDVLNKLGTGVGSVVKNVDNTVSDLDTIITGVKKGKGVMGAMLVDKTRYDSVFTNTMRDIEETAQEAKLAASRLAENMEALKHNWLFKSYFEERGYWDKAEYEDDINSKLKELDAKMKEIDEKIQTLKDMENKK
jgi:phospholipid/cholesterol/gamma-HCH transport system substrate-binding protein